MEKVLGFRTGARPLFPKTLGKVKINSGQGSPAVRHGRTHALISSVGRIPPWYGGDHEFEPRIALARGAGDPSLF